MEVKDPATALLLQILVGHPMEPAARLKQKLSAALVDKGLGPFDQKTVGFKTFKDYLRSLGDLLVIEEKSGSDILVSLGKTLPTKTDSDPETPPPLRSDVWLAFTNPDPNRVRFYNKSTNKVVHFHTTDQAAASIAEGSDLVAIPAIDGTRQVEWMHEFLAQNFLSEDPLLNKIADAPFSSSVNTAFARALGKYGLAWRKFRASKVFVEATAWVARHEASIDWLRAPPDSPASAGSGHSMSPRLRASKLLESFSDQELIETVIPILAASILVKSRA
ncbi:hypothetical protein [Lysobacter capsici]|uniref:hypothetical protein n=1 Tax=Lysobacter capsici TaxID=435897 RepID=UPI000A655E18|nr:hypothetical protein [Lysobacter capsici]